MFSLILVLIFAALIVKSNKRKMGEAVIPKENQESKISKVHTFVVSDESIVTTYGFRVMTAGIELVQYKKNPIILFYHKRPSKWEGKQDKNSEVLPIGKATKVWKEDGKLMAEAVFDLNDPFAAIIEDKLTNGFMRMCSPGLDPITVSDDPKYLLPGQTRRSLVKSRLEEISIVDRGGNDNAIRLMKEGQLIELSADGDNNIIPNINSKQILKMDTLKTQLAPKLELNAEASDDAFVSAIDKLLGEQGYKAKFVALSAEQDQNREERIKSLVKQNVDKKFTGDKEAYYVELGATLGESELIKLFGNLPAISGKPTDDISAAGGETGGGSPAKSGEYKTLTELAAKGTDFMATWAEKNPEAYEKLEDAHFAEDSE